MARQAALGAAIPSLETKQSSQNNRAKGVASSALRGSWLGIEIKGDRMNGSTPETPELINLALAKFGRLTDSELNMLRAANSGGFAFCGPSPLGEDPANDPAQTAGWGNERTIRASVIRWLCVDHKAKDLVDPHGVWIHAARIEDMLDLSFVTVSFPLFFDNCLFTGAVILLCAKLGSLSIRASRSSTILGVGLEVRNDLVLQAGNSEGLVRLRGASIGGNLLCDDQRFQKGLEAAGIRTSGAVSLRASVIGGALELALASIGLNLDCEKASLKNPEGAALDAAGLNVRGDVFLRNGFSAIGTVKLIGAEIGGSFQCDNGKFKNPDGNALYADRIKVGGSLYLRTGFDAEGEVRLLGAHIGANLGCNGGIFKNPRGIALFASDIKVTGSVFLRDGMLVEGEVRLVAAEIGGTVECIKAQFRNPGGPALRGNGIKVGRSVTLGEGSIFDGEVSFTHSNISGAFSCGGCSFVPNSTLNAEQTSVSGSFFWRNVSTWRESGRSQESDAPARAGLPVRLNLQHTQVGPLADETSSWPSVGMLHLNGFTYTAFGSGPSDAKSRLEWLNRQDNIFQPQPYRQLAKVLGDAGDDSGARRVFIAMENARLRLGKLRWYSRAWTWASRLTIGYGYQPFRAGWWVAAFVLAGFFLFSWGQDAGVLKQLPDQNAAAYQPFNAFVYSLETFVPLVDLQFAKHWLPAAQLVPEHSVDLLKHLRHWPFRWLPLWEHQFAPNFGEHLRWYFWLHILAGWFFTTMFVAGVTGLVRKD